MHVLITGAAGFVGQLVAQNLLNDGQHKVVMTDIVKPSVPGDVKYPQNATLIAADLYHDAQSVVEEGIDIVFVFHGIMSAQSEENFDLCREVNVTATLNLLESLRRYCPGVRVIYASSLAVYGNPLPEVVNESVRPTPESSYGAAKLVCETLVNDYTRKGFLDGFILRFPTVVVRSGKPSEAASAFLSGMIREPLNGEECTIPLEDRSFESWLCSASTLANNLLHAMEVPPSSLPSHDRVVNMPGKGVTIQQMMDALERVAGKDKLRLLKEKTDPAKEKILRSWAFKLDNTKAYSLGYQEDADFEQAVREYQEKLHQK